MSDSNTSLADGRMTTERRRWTARDLRMLRELYPDCLATTVARELGRPVSSVYQMADKLGLTKSEAFYASDISGRVQRGKQHPSMVASQFKPGQAAWNKGQKGATGHHPNTRATQFRKGEKRGAAQHNYVPIGTHRISADGLLERKVSDDPDVYPARRWMGVHRIVWEAAHGPIPVGNAVVFRPGSKTTDIDSITLDRLELLTRAQLMQRNSYHTNFPPEVRQLVQLRGALTRQINARSRDMENS